MSSSVLKEFMSTSGTSALYVLFKCYKDQREKITKKHYQAMFDNSNKQTMPTMFLINTDTLAGLLHSAAHSVLSGRRNSR